MNRRPQTRISFIGKILLLIGVVALVLGLVLFILTGSAFSFWTVIASVLFNVVGITLMTMKPRG